MIPWEERRDMRAWWITCMRVTEPPTIWLDEVLAGRVLPAVAFALLAEVLAVASYAIPVVLGGQLILAAFGAASPAGGLVRGTLGACLGLGAFMVLLHVVWVAVLEVLLILRRRKAQWGPAMLLGLYACGWDMVTSPGGVILGLPYGGWSRVGRLLRGATANPRAACLYYLVTTRDVSPKMALRLAIAAAVFAVLLGIVGAAGLVWWWDPHMWSALATLIHLIRS